VTTESESRDPAHLVEDTGMSERLSVAIESPPATETEPLPHDGRPARFFFRELSWLRFNERVLEEAVDQRLPLAERARFMAIVSSNLDEFVMVRFAALLTEGPQDVSECGMDASMALAQVRSDIAAQVARQYHSFTQLRQELELEGLKLVPREEWTESEQRRAETYFRQSLELTLTPLAVGPSHPFPLLANLRLHVVLSLHSDTDDEERFALVGIPSGEPRLFRLSDGRFALLEDVVRSFVAQLFPGSSVTGSGTLRVTRDGTIDIDEDQTTDLLTEIEQGLRLRGRGVPVRLEVDANMPQRMREWLCEELRVSPLDTFAIPGPLDLRFLSDAAETGLELHQFASFRPAPCPVPWTDPFATLREQSVMLHHPYDSFDPVVEFVRQAVRDPNVLAIKQTLYRVSGDSPIVKALIDAALAGKQVTVLCELKARFDESRNIDWARRLERAGAHVLYGVLGYKVHAKLLLIVRRDDDGVRRYAHLGTGNYNDRTARMYEDFSYFTANEAVCRDVGKLFNMLTGFSRPPAWERLIVAPLTFRSTIQEYIAEELKNAKKGLPASIFGKCNSLVDTQVCEWLYKASQAGVQIDLVVRGVCILRPGVPGMSDNIRVRSVIGRFLEHSRIFRFAGGGRPKYLFGSGDWMTRNFDWRVESLVHLSEPEFQAEFDAIIERYLADRRNTRLLMPDGTYVHLGRECSEPGLQDLFIQDRTSKKRRTASASERLIAFTPARRTT
jgi:polyphosphate kinase